MFLRKRFWNTAAMRGRSSARPVSFSTIEARISASSGVLIGEAGVDGAPRPWRETCVCAACMRSMMLLARVVAAELVGVGKQAALGRDLGDVADQLGIGLELLDDLQAGQPFGNGHLVLDRLALDQVSEHLAHRRVLTDLVFARLELPAPLRYLK